MADNPIQQIAGMMGRSPFAKKMMPQQGAQGSGMPPAMPFGYNPQAPSFGYNPPTPGDVLRPQTHQPSPFGYNPPPPMFDPPMLPPGHSGPMHTVGPKKKKPITAYNT